MNPTTSAPARQRDTARKPHPKPQRFIRVEVPPTYNGLGIVRITVGKEYADYFLTELPAGFGRGFTAEKIGLHENDPPYHVNIDADINTIRPRRRTTMNTLLKLWNSLATLAGNVAALAATVAELNGALRQRVGLDGVDPLALPATGMPVPAPAVAQAGDAAPEAAPRTPNGRKRATTK
jgi:hypothetical protein